jgi:hypothetical protein
MLHIKCDHCGRDLKGQEVIVEPFYNYTNGIKYKDYTTTCSMCGSVISWDRYVQKAEENKTKAIGKKIVPKISLEEQYNTIMRKVVKKAIIPPSYFPKNKDVSRLIAELPEDEKQIVLEYEDNEDMKILNQECHKQFKHININGLLLLYQDVIIDALKDKDEDFFKTKYGDSVVDAYNSALTLYKGHNYNITAALLLEKIQNGEAEKILELLGYMII